LDTDSPALLTTRSTPPKAQARSATGLRDLRLVGDVERDRDGTSPAPIAAHGCAAAPVEVGDDHAGTLSREALGDGLADAQNRPR
jgi:hypothetical protein